MCRAVITSFRLGGTDGVSVIAATWEEILTELGFAVSTVAGEGSVDVVVPGLELGAADPPDRAELAEAFDEADLVVVENLLTIPMNLPASEAVAAVLAGRPALLHHHDPPWHRAHHRHVTLLPADDPTWRHVTPTASTTREMASRGIAATTIPNGFRVPAAVADPAAARAALGVAADELVVLHPVRAIARKDVPAAVRLTEELGGTYWLTGPAEDGYGPELASVIRRARCRVLHRPWHDLGEMYAASDLVAFPSTWEGFGNPPIEAALHRRPAAVGRYRVAIEHRELGFEWFDPAEPEAIRDWIADPDDDLLDRNFEVARANFSMQVVTERLARLLDEAGWLP